MSIDLRREAQNILLTAKTGVLNGHFAILPNIRGMDTIEWSVLKGQEVGITVHFVDPGVDTGRIILKKRVETHAMNNLAVLREECRQMAVRGLIEAVDKFEQNAVSSTPQLKKDGKQYFKMNPFFIQKVESLLNNECTLNCSR